MTRFKYIFAAGLCALLPVAALAGTPAAADTPAVVALSGDAIATPALSAATMRQLREGGYRSVSIDAWDDGYTQFPSAVLFKALGVRLHPALAAQQSRDLLQETLIEAQRNGLATVVWFGAGIRAADKDPGNLLRQKKPDWLVRGAGGAELVQEGEAWINPLHPDARRFLLELMLEVVDQYDIDGLRIDQRMAWPPLPLQNDAYTRGLYAADHGGKMPAGGEADAEWVRWRTARTSENTDYYLQALRAKRPRLFISQSRDDAPDFPPQWRKKSLVASPLPLPPGWNGGGSRWEVRDLPKGRYHLIGFNGSSWDYLEDFRQDINGDMWSKVFFFTPFRYVQVEVVNDRRFEMRRALQ